eukprot:8662237-Pyramimonas_sp.AAC.1
MMFPATLRRLWLLASMMGGGPSADQLDPFLAQACPRSLTLSAMVERRLAQARAGAASREPPRRPPGPSARALLSCLSGGAGDG